MKPEEKKEEFLANPNLFIEKAIKEFVASSSLNKLSSFNGATIFNQPLVAFSDGDDPIYQDYKRIIGDFHLTPREVLDTLDGKGSQGKTVKPARVSVVSWVLPATYETRITVRKETVVTTLRWNHSRWQGQDFTEAMARHLISLLEGLGYRAVAPAIAEFFTTIEMPDGMSSNWSERHAAYAAGLGTFSLNDAFITPLGIAIRCGSLISDAPFTPSPRTCENHLSNCTFYRDKSCVRCIERCPVGAVTEAGHDKKKCREFLITGQKEIMKILGKYDGFLGRYMGCGLCQTKVPCEDRIPPQSLRPKAFA
ncbi:MAG: epoxyqueuosine reductase [Dehalococcoidia bacterium]|nr:epoxyqueuosine reductase [Dehalococcoidia bacterium]